MRPCIRGAGQRSDPVMDHTPEIDDEPVIAGCQRSDTSNQRNFHPAHPEIAIGFYRDVTLGARAWSGLWGGSDAFDAAAMVLAYGHTFLILRVCQCVISDIWPGSAYSFVWRGCRPLVPNRCRTGRLYTS